MSQTDIQPQNGPDLDPTRQPGKDEDSAEVRIEATEFNTANARRWRIVLSETHLKLVSDDNEAVTFARASLDRAITLRDGLWMRRLVHVDIPGRGQRLALRLEVSAFDQLRVWLSEGGETLLRNVLSAQFLPLALLVVLLFSSDLGSWSLWLSVFAPVLLVRHFGAKKWPHRAVLLVSCVLSLVCGAALSVNAWLAGNAVLAVVGIGLGVVHALRDARAWHLVRDVAVAKKNRVAPVAMIASTFVSAVAAGVLLVYAGEPPEELPITDADVDRVIGIGLPEADSGEERWQKWRSGQSEYLEYSFVPTGEETPLLVSFVHSAPRASLAHALFRTHEAGLLNHASSAEESTESECVAPDLGDERRCTVLQTTRGQRLHRYVFRLGRLVIGATYAIRTVTDAQSIEDALAAQIERLRSESQ